MIHPPHAWNVISHEGQRGRTSGMWFSTASIMTRCCRCAAPLGTCMRRAGATNACGTSPSPPISLLHSTAHHRCCCERWRAGRTSLVKSAVVTSERITCDSRRHSIAVIGCRCAMLAVTPQTSCCSAGTCRHWRSPHRNVAAPGVDDDHTATALGRQHARDVPQDGGLPGPGPPQDENGLAAAGQVRDQRRAARHRPPHAAGEPHDATVPVTQAADAVQRAVNAGPVVLAKLTDLGQSHTRQARVDHERINVANMRIPKVNPGVCQHLKQGWQYLSATQLVLRQHPKCMLGTGAILT